HGGVLVEGDVGAVVAAELLLRAHHHGGHDLALLHRPVRDGLLDRADDDVADAGIAAVATAAHSDAEQLAGAGVVGDLESGFLLDHRLAGPLQHFDEAPALGAAERTALDQADRVADVGLVLLVVRVQRGRRADDLLVHPVLPGHVDADRDGLVGLVGDDDALAHLEGALGGDVLDRHGGRLAARLTRPPLALLLAIGAPLPRLRAAALGTLLRPLLGGALRPHLAAVKRTRAF